MRYNKILGGLSEVVRPDPIPNSVVKHFSGDDNVDESLCENTSLPGLYFLRKPGGHVCQTIILQRT